MEIRNSMNVTHSNKLSQLMRGELLALRHKICEAAHQLDHGFVWNPANRQGKSADIFSDNSLYTGNAGVLWFLMQYQKTFSDETLLPLIQGGLQHLAKTATQTKYNLGFLPSSRYSSLFTLCCGATLQHVSKDAFSKVLHQALDQDLSRDFRDQPTDFFQGLSGSLYVYLSIYLRFPEEKLLKLIIAMLEALVSQISFSQHGCVFHRGPAMTQPICGLAHGGAGIAFVLLECGRLFENNDLLNLGRRCLRAENQRYSSLLQGWPDFRVERHLDHWDPIMKALYLCGERRPTHHFHPAMNAYCNGLAGIAMVNLHAFGMGAAILNKSGLRHLCRLSSDEIHQSSLRTGKNLPFVLCHGLAGNADLLIQASAVFQESRYLQQARMGALRLIAQKRRHGSLTNFTGINGPTTPPPLALFLGMTGLGHLFLRLLDPKKTSSLLLPVLPSSKKLTKPKGLPISVRKILTRRLFRLSLRQNLITEDVVEKLVLQSLEPNSEGMPAFDRALNNSQLTLTDKQQQSLLVDYKSWQFTANQRNFVVAAWEAEARRAGASHFQQLLGNPSLWVQLDTRNKRWFRTIPAEGSALSQWPVFDFQNFERDVVFFYSAGQVFFPIVLNPLALFICCEAAKGPVMLTAMHQKVTQLMAGRELPLGDFERFLLNLVQNGMLQWSLDGGATASIS